MFRAAFLAVIAATGCTWVYDAQYNDRAGELEAFRSDFLPATDQVQWFTAIDDKLFWEDRLKPLETPLLHSYVPTTGARIEYAYTSGNTNIKMNYVVGSKLILRCGFSVATAYDASMANPTPIMTASNDMVSDECAVAGTDVFFHVARTIRRWTPSTGAPTVQVVDLAAAGVGTGTFGGFAVLGKKLVLEEGGRLWLVDLMSGSATWLENMDQASGTIAFDDQGVLYDGPKGIDYTQFSDHAAFLLQDAIANGGYDLSFEKSDIQNVQDVGQYALFEHHVVYRATNGIFAYGFDTTKVVDLLLDRGSGFDASPRYESPTVTSDGTLFVDDHPELGSTHTIYRVDLTGRLR